MPDDSGTAQQFGIARGRATEALRELAAAFRLMIGLLDPVEGDHDDVASLLDASSVLQELARDVKQEIQGEGGIVLAWLLQNSGGVRSVRVGEMKYYGEKEKSVKCLDVGVAGETLAQIRLEQRLLVVAGGGDPEEFWPGVRDLFREVVSTNGLKDGACRQALADDAERTLLSEIQLNPAALQPLDGETPEAALKRVIEAAREAAYLAHFEESWPDKMKGAEAKAKLGVANLRFLARRGGGTKEELMELDRQRLLEMIS